MKSHCRIENVQRNIVIFESQLAISVVIRLDDGENDLRFTLCSECKQLDWNLESYSGALAKKSLFKFM